MVLFLCNIFKLVNVWLYILQLILYFFCVPTQDIRLRWILYILTLTCFHLIVWILFDLNYTINDSCVSVAFYSWTKWIFMSYSDILIFIAYCRQLKLTFRMTIHNQKRTLMIITRIDFLSAAMRRSWMWPLGFFIRWYCNKWLIFIPALKSSWLNPV